jgi:hypothetical protein
MPPQLIVIRFLIMAPWSCPTDFYGCPLLSYRAAIAASGKSRVAALVSRANHPSPQGQLNDMLAQTHGGPAGRCRGGSAGRGTTDVIRYTEYPVIQPKFRWYGEI